MNVCPDCQKKRETRLVKETLSHYLYRVGCRCGITTKKEKKIAYSGGGMVCPSCGDINCGGC